MTKLPAFSFSSILGGSALVFSCRLLGAALALLLQILLARWIGASELGIYVFAFSSLILAATLSQMGFMPATVRVVGHALAHDRPAIVWGYLRRAVQVIAGSSASIAIIGILYVWMFGQNLPGGIKLPYFIAAATIPLLALQNYQGSVAQAFRWWPLAVVPGEIIRPIAVLLVIGILWLFADGVTASVVLSIQTSVLILTASGLALLIRPRIKNAVPPAQPSYDMPLWVRTALPLMLISLFGHYFPELILVLIGGMLAPEKIAIFNAAYRLALAVTFGLNAIDTVTAPVALRLFETGKTADLQRIVTRAAVLGVGGSLIAITCFYFLGTFLLGLFGPEFTSGYDVLMILVFSQVVRSAAGPVMPLLAMTGNQNRALIVLITSILFTVISTLLFTPIYGMKGAAISVLLVTMGWSVWLNVVVTRHIGVRASIFSMFRQD